MRITFVGHASILVESGDVALLTDPWWAGPCFGAQWWIHPDPYLDAIEHGKITHIYVSHGHNDHLHPGTLAKFPRDVKVLVAKELDVGPALQKMGFDVLELPDGEAVSLGIGVTAAIRPTVGGDSLLVVADQKEVCVNLNDALHATPAQVQDRFIAWLKAEHPAIDYLFCGYGTASHFPNCYRIPGKDYEKSAVRRQHHFNLSWARIVQELGPKFAFPFAADVALLEHDLFWSNQPVHNSERPVHLLSGNGIPNGTQSMDLGPGFTIESGNVTRPVLRKAVSDGEIRQLHKDQIEKANYYPEITAAEVREVLPPLQQNLNVCEEYLRAFSGGYKVLLRFRNSEHGIAIDKARGKISARVAAAGPDDLCGYDLLFTTRLPYLKRSLNSPYGNEVMFVGSGCLFDLPDVSTARRRIHEEVRQIVTRHEICPPPRKVNPASLVYKSKQFIKQTLGIEEEDLYDLEKWTVFTGN